jgi:hypothetical protein
MGKVLRTLLHTCDDPGSCHASPGLTLAANTRNRKTDSRGPKFPIVTVIRLDVRIPQKAPKLPMFRGVLSPNFRLSAYHFRYRGLFCMTIPTKIVTESLRYPYRGIIVIFHVKFRRPAAPNRDIMTLRSVWASFPLNHARGLGCVLAGPVDQTTFMQIPIARILSFSSPTLRRVTDLFLWIGNVRPHFTTARKGRLSADSGTLLCPIIHIPLHL